MSDFNCAICKCVTRQSDRMFLHSPKRTVCQSCGYQNVNPPEKTTQEFTCGVCDRHTSEGVIEKVYLGDRQYKSVPTCRDCFSARRTAIEQRLSAIGTRRQEIWEEEQLLQDEVLRLHDVIDEPIACDRCGKSAPWNRHVPLLWKNGCTTRRGCKECQDREQEESIQRQLLKQKAKSEVPA